MQYIDDPHTILEAAAWLHLRDDDLAQFYDALGCQSTFARGMFVDDDGIQFQFSFARPNKRGKQLIEACGLE